MNMNASRWILCLFSPSDFFCFPEPKSDGSGGRAKRVLDALHYSSPSIFTTVGTACPQSLIPETGVLQILER